MSRSRLLLIFETRSEIIPLPSPCTNHEKPMLYHDRGSADQDRLPETYFYHDALVREKKILLTNLYYHKGETDDQMTTLGGGERRGDKEEE